MLEASGRIEILNSDNEIIHVLDKDTVKSEEASIVHFENELNNIKLRFTNIKVGGNYRIDFIKSI